MLPAEGVQPRHVEQLSRRAVGHAGVEHDLRQPGQTISRTIAANSPIVRSSPVPTLIVDSSS